MEDKELFVSEKLKQVRELKATRQEILRQIQLNTSRKKTVLKAIDDLEEAKHIISSEMVKIQSTLKEDIDSLVTIALRIVYEGRDIEFGIKFGKTPSGTSTYKPAFIENGEEFDPKEEQCGGALDVSSYSLQTILMNFE